MAQVTVKVQELQVGDEFWSDGRKHYTVIEEPTLLSWLNGVSAPVMFADGGTGRREWDLDQTITVERA